MELSAAVIVRVVASLFFVLGAVVALARFIEKRHGVGGGDGWIRVLASHSLAPGTQLHLVQILGNYYVLSSGGGQARLVTRLNTGETDASLPDFDPVVAVGAVGVRDRALRQFLSLERIRGKEM